MKVKIKKLGTVDAEIVRENKKTIWVRLLNGDIVKRHKNKHIG